MTNELFLATVGDTQQAGRTSSRVAQGYDRQGQEFIQDCHDKEATRGPKEEGEGGDYDDVDPDNQRFVPNFQRPSIIPHFYLL